VPLRLRFTSWPPALSWLLAIGCIVFASMQFREAFRR
jgi:hypothetical protein